MKFQSHFKNGIASALVVGTLLLPMEGMADSKTVSGWGQIIGGAAGGALGWICTDFFLMAAVNVDAAQLALEYLVYDAMKNVTDKWEPEPKESYTQSASSNECNSSVKTTSVTEKGSLDFEVQALTNVGIEAVEVTRVYDIAGSRDKVVENLTRLTYDADELVLNFDLNHEENDMIDVAQAKNYQWLSTAGIARAELGLKTVSQAAVDAGGDAAEITDDASSSKDVELAAEGATKVDTSLTGLPKTITSTGMGMRVQSLMNLELAQRVNLANALQGNSLVIEAARALRNAPRIIPED